jgi:carbon monoxide dehydrogenase subunit G
VDRAIAERVVEGLVDEAVLLEQREPVEARARDDDLEVVASAGPVLDDELRRIGKRLLEAGPEWLDGGHDAMLPTQPMPSAEHSIAIDRPVEEVFAFVADKENDARWRPGVQEITKASGDGVGAVYHQRVKGPGGKAIPADIEITELEPNRVIGFRTIEGPVRPEGRFELEATDGGTRVTFSLRAELRGLKRLMTGMVAKTMRRELDALDNLKRVLEQER